MRKTVRFSLFAVLLASVVTGCSGRHDEGPAVATPSLAFNRDRLPIGSAATLTYKFVVAQNASFDKDYWVFVHVLDPEGEQMWTDDHQPPTPTSKWKAGETVEYKRTIFIPNYPYVGEAVVRLGLYDRLSGKRTVLNGHEASGREYMVAKVQIAPSAENILVLYKDGWHNIENGISNPETEWRWTKKTSTLSFKNPKKDATLYLEYSARPDIFTLPQQVTLRIGEHPIGQFAADTKLPTLLRFPLTAAQMGASDMVDLIIDVDRTFKPGGLDQRELGISVFQVYVESK